MKKIISAIAFLCLVTLILAYSCSGNKKEKQSLQALSRIEVSVGGMTCTGCEQTIQSHVGKLEGIKSVKASYTDGKAIIEYNPQLTDTLKIRDAITGSGYIVNKFITSN